MNVSVKSAEVYDLTKVSESYPGLPDPLVRRDKEIRNIENLLSSQGYSVVVVKGDEGYGITTLMAQFVDANPSNCISVFLGPSRSQHDPFGVKADISNQISWILEREEIRDSLAPEKDPQIDVIYNTYIRKLNRRFRNKNKTCYFVVDGIDEIPEGSEYAREEIIDITPFSEDNIKVIISGGVSNIPQHVEKNSVQELPIGKFGLEDTQKVIGEYFEKNEVKRVHNICNKIPRRIGLARRIVDQVGTKKFLDSLTSGSLDEILKIEWKNAIHKVDPFLLSVVAFSESPVPFEFVSELIDKHESAEELAEDIGFLEKTNDDRIKYTSYEYKKYSKKEMSDMSHESREWLIENYRANQDDPRSLLNLPHQLDAANKTKELIDFLSPGKFFQLIKYGQSIGLASSTADAGVKAAKSESLLGPLLRFCLHQSTVLKLIGSRVVQTEAEAFAALGKYGDALALADSVLAEEKKLELLSVIVREQSFGPDPVDKEIMLQIRRLCESINENNTQLNTQKVSTNLIHVDPELALELLETVSGSTEGEYSLDVAYLKLAVMASLQSVEGEEMYREQSLESARSKMEDPEAKKISSATELLLGDYSAEAVIDKAKELGKTEHRMLFLRNWTKSHRKSEEAEKVVRFALKEVRGNTDYGQDMGLLREVATPLPHIDDRDTAKRLVNIVDRYKENANDLPEEKIRLELLLARSEARYDLGAASDRLTEVWIELDEGTPDLATKVEGLARLCASLSSDALKSGAGGNTTIAEVGDAAESSLEESVGDLLKSTAEHFEVTKNAVAALATTNFEKALTIAESLNTVQRRDKALEVLADTVIREGPSDSDISNIFKILDRVSSESSKNSIIYNAVDRYGDEEYPSLSERDISAISGKIDDISNSSTRFKAYMSSHAFFNKDVVSDEEKYDQKSFEKGLDAFDSIDNDWRKVRTGFETVKKLSNKDSTRASDLMDKVSNVKEIVIFKEEAVSDAFVESVKLAIRAYGGLLEQELETEEELKDVQNAIERLDSKVDRVELFSDLSFEYWKRGRNTEFRKLVKDEVKNILYSLKSDSITDYYRSWTYAGPCMYMWETEASIRKINDIPREYSDVVYTNIIKSIAYGTLPSEPVFEASKSIKTAPRPLIDKALKAASEIEDGSKFFWAVNTISKIIKSDEYHEYDDNYMSYVRERLDRMSDSKLPARDKFISHKGYLILSKAAILSIKNEYKSVNKQEWINLTKEARDIENMADRAFVLSKLSDKFPGAKSVDLERQSEMVNDASDIASNLPSSYDRIVRLKSIASTAGSVDEDLARECYKEAITDVFQGSFSLATKSRSKLKRNIISSAYRRIGSDFASSLAKLFDDEEAHQREIQRSIDDIEASQNISNGNDPGSANPKVFWRPLSRLNAGLIAPPKKERVQQLLLEGLGHPLGDAYPVYSFSVRGLVRSYADKDQASQMLRPVFRAALQNATLVSQLSARSTSGSKWMDDVEPSGNDKSGLPIPPDTRDRALTILEQWLENKGSNKLIICDQYFGPRDVEALFMAESSSKVEKIEILSSIKHFEQEKIEKPTESFKEEWSNRYESEMPNCRIVLVGIEETHKSPFHDRFWISGENGIYMGNSFGSIGRDQYCEIIKMNREEVISKKEEMEGYLQMRKRIHNGSDLKYNLHFAP
jgi:hypothetical protein